MSDFTVVARGPWRIRPSVFDGKACVSNVADGRSEVVTVEDLADLAQLRDAITDYLTAQEANR